MMGVLLFIGPGPVVTLIMGAGAVRCGLCLGGMVNSQLGAAFGRGLELLDIPSQRLAISERSLFRKGTTCRLRS